MPHDPLLDRLRASTPRGIGAAVRIKTAGTAYGERTVVRIDHRLPEPSRGTDAVFRVTTREQFLPRAHFDRSVRETVNRAALERGRRIYAIELRNPRSHGRPAPARVPRRPTRQRIQSLRATPAPRRYEPALTSAGEQAPPEAP